MDRIPCISRNGKFYMKLSTAANKLAQTKWKEKHDLDPNAHACAAKRSSTAILFRLETNGSVPHLGSFRKYPEEITSHTVQSAYTRWKESNTDPDKFLKVQRKMTSLYMKRELLDTVTRLRV